MNNRGRVWTEMELEIGLIRELFGCRHVDLGLVVCVVRPVIFAPTCTKIFNPKLFICNF